MSARTIVVVEDSELSMELVSDLLELAGYRVVQAVTAEAGIAAAIEQRPDLILMDVALPHMDGMEAARRLRRDPRTAAIPVVALSAQAMERDRLRAIEAGCCGIITKPIDTRTFAATVAGFFGGGAAPGPPAAGDGPADG